MYQQAHRTSPVTFAFSRPFFRRQTDLFSKAFFLLRNYEPKIARLKAGRMVVTDYKVFSDGVLIDEELAGDSPLRDFRVDVANVGQYSPTRPSWASLAAEIIAKLKQASFDPTGDVVVETTLRQTWYWLTPRVL